MNPGHTQIMSSFMGSSQTSQDGSLSTRCSAFGAAATRAAPPKLHTCPPGRADPLGRFLRSPENKVKSSEGKVRQGPSKVSSLPSYWLSALRRLSSLPPDWLLMRPLVFGEGACDQIKIRIYCSHIHGRLRALWSYLSRISIQVSNRTGQVGERFPPS